MVIYEREEKILIIPEGADCGCSSGGSRNCEREYRRGYNDGFEDGLEACSGYTPTDCSSAITEAYSSGVTAGKAEQKSLLVLTAITENGTYERENGWNRIVVDTPTCNLVEAMIPLTQSFTGRTVINPDAPYNGFSKITIIDGGFGSTMFQNGYTSGVTNGFASGYTSGWTDGVAYASRKQVTLKLWCFGDIWASVYEYDYGNTIAINGAQPQYCKVNGSFHNPSFIEISGYTQDSSINTIQVCILVGSGSFPTDWEATAYINSVPTVIVSQSCSTRVVDTDYGWYTEYAYTFTFNNAPIYDKASYEAGLAACQNNEQED